MQTLMPIVVFLSWLALPVGLLCIADDWFLRPRRQIAAAPQEAHDPLVIAVAYHALPILIGAAVLRLLVAERLDFSAVLFGITLLTGLVWGVDALILARRRAATAKAAGKDLSVIREPGTVDYARSFFPVALVVLVLSWIPDVALLVINEPGATVPAVASLMLMHAVTALICVTLLVRLSRGR